MSKNRRKNKKDCLNKYVNILINLLLFLLNKDFTSKVLINYNHEPTLMNIIPKRKTNSHERLG
jgi:hypothetical protein